jgi:hypothetical protein
VNLVAFNKNRVQNMMYVKCLVFFSVFVTQFESTPSRKEQNPLFLEIAQIASFWQGQKIKDQSTVMAIFGRTLYSPIQLHGGQAVAHTVAQLYRVFCVGKSCSFVNDSHYI